MKRFSLIFLSGVTVLLCLILFPFSSVLGKDVTFLIQKGDELYAQRGDVEKSKESVEFYKKALEIDPDNYEANWKACRSFAYVGSAAPIKDTATKKEYGEMAMPYGKKAFQLKPDAVEGHYYYCMSLWQYGTGCGVLNALAKGVGDKFESHYATVLKLDEYYDRAGIFRAIGRYYYLIPWPMRDLERSEKNLVEATTYAPENIKGHFLLAETYKKRKKYDLAKKELELAINIEPNYTHEPEADLWKKEAKDLLKSIK